MNSYGAPSALIERPGGHRLGLETASALTPSGHVDRPVFFTGLLARPDIAASGLLAVADVAGSTYADFGLMQRLANLDPVVTASGDRLRFESFSACNSVHARLDLLPAGLAGGDVGFGTTNVDINQPLRVSLARLGSADLLHLTVGPDELRAATPDEHHVERKVALPDRWVRGLAEVPSIAVGMHQSARLSGDSLVEFARSLPRSTSAGPTLHLLANRRGLRLLPRGLPGTIAIHGVGRLRGMDRILRFTTELVIHQDQHGATGWVFELPGARFTLVLTANPYRGFSGEGTLLSRLASNTAELAGRRLLVALGWAPVIDAAELRTSTGLSEEAVTSGLAWLAASGRLGFDLSERAWFHRELPLDTEKVLRHHPRLRHALELVEDGGIRREHDHGTWMVRGRDQEHSVTGHSLDALTCTCPWAESHAAGRGPCKHILAVTIAESDAAPTIH